MFTGTSRNLARTSLGLHTQYRLARTQWNIYLKTTLHLPAELPGMHDKRRGQNLENCLDESYALRAGVPVHIYYLFDYLLDLAFQLLSLLAQR